MYNSLPVSVVCSTATISQWIALPTVTLLPLLPAQSFLTVNIGVVFIHVWCHVLKLDDTVLPIASYHNAELVLPKEKHSFVPCDLLLLLY